MATRKPPTKAPEHARLSADQMRRGIKRLGKLIEQVQAFDTASICERGGAEQTAVEAAIDGDLASVFGHGTVEYNRYAPAKSLDNGPIAMTFGWENPNPMREIEEARQYLADGKAQSIQLIKQAVRWLESELDDAEQEPQLPAALASSASDNKKVFIVHGHDDAARESVARFLAKGGFQSIILSEQANQGRTIIEKIEAEADVGFAVVLLTPDDVGGKPDAPLKPRARQNVLLELGYFFAKLNRSRVCALTTSDDIELPTDFAGVVWERMDTTGGWKLKLARELKAAGYSVDVHSMLDL